MKLTINENVLEKLKQLARKLWQWKAPGYKVLLINRDTEMKVVRAWETQAGWIANWYGGSDTYNLLLKGGKVAGYDRIKMWLPHSGWDAAELEQLQVLDADSIGSPI